MRRPASVLALAVLPLVLLTACSGGDEPAPADDPVVSAAPSQSADIAGLDVVEEELSRAHVTGEVEYAQSPPVGGDHNQRWLACDVYDEPVPDAFAVHSLEHGAVWLTHRPDLPAADVERLAELAERNEEYVLVSPYEGLTSPVVAVAWGRSLSVDSADDPRLGQLVEVFAGGAQGGEPGVPCRQQGVTPREAAGLLGQGSA